MQESVSNSQDTEMLLGSEQQPETQFMSDLSQEEDGQPTDATLQEHPALKLGKPKNPSQQDLGQALEVQTLPSLGHGDAGQAAFQQPPVLGSSHQGAELGMEPAGVAEQTSVVQTLKGGKNGQAGQASAAALEQPPALEKEKPDAEPDLPGQQKKQKGSQHGADTGAKDTGPLSPRLEVRTVLHA